LKNTSPHSGGSVIDVRDYIKRALFPFSMFQVMIIIKHTRESFGFNFGFNFVM
jgi:hypothetical protein